MEKFTQAPVGLDIDQTVSSNSQAISNYIDSGVCKRLASGTAVKSVSQNGRYYAITAPDTPSGVSQSGFLDVYIFADGYKRLIFHPVDVSSVYVASSYNGTWTGWQELATKSDISTISSPTSLTSNTSYVQSGYDVKYSRLGKLVFVNMDFTLTQAFGNNNMLFTGLPISGTGAFWITVTGADNKSYRLLVSNSGEIKHYYGATLPVQSYNHSFMYFANSFS